MSIPELQERRRIRQCPQCGYGPVINTQCSDMVSHDAQRGSAQDRATNSCGKCGFFAERFESWRVWRPEQAWAAASCPLCKASCQLSPLSIVDVKTRFAHARKFLDELPGELHKSMELAADLVTIFAFQKGFLSRTC